MKFAGRPASVTSRVGSQSAAFRKAAGSFTDAAVHYSAQPFQAAANMGMNVGGFFLGELGYAFPANRPEHNPSMIESWNGSALPPLQGMPSMVSCH